MTYHDRLDDLADRSSDALVALAERFKAGELTEDQYRALSVALVLRSKAEATAFADVALAADLTVKVGAAVPALGLLPAGGQAARLDKAFTTMLDAMDPGPLDPSEAQRLSRLARDETLKSAQEARGEGIKRSRHTTGWTRGLNPGACPICTGWAGPVLPKSARMARHTGCSCVQTPAVRTTTTRR